MANIASTRHNKFEHMSEVRRR